MAGQVLDPLDKIREPGPARERQGRRDPLLIAQQRQHNNERANLIRDRIPLSDVVGRVVTLKKRSRVESIGLCPFHNEATPSFTVNDKKGFYHCFGCGAHGDAIDFVAKRQGYDFLEALDLLESENGLRHLKASLPAPPPSKVPQAVDVKKADDIARTWQECRHDPVVGAYLAGRKIPPPASYGFADATVNGGWPVDLRYHPALFHGGERVKLPAMVAAFRPHADAPVAALHRTYLKITGTGVTKAGLGQQDKMHWGPRKGCAIWLGPVTGKMIEAEGIETTLSAMFLFARSGFAAGSADALEAVEPPFECDDLVIAADWGAKNRIGEQRAHAARRRYATGGRSIVVKVPNLRHLPKADFNDVLTLSAEEKAAPKPKPVPPIVKAAVPPPRVDRAADKRDLQEALRTAKANEREAWPRYSAAEDARGKVDEDDAAALADAQRELRGAGDAWKHACAVTTSILDSQRRVA